MKLQQMQQQPSTKQTQLQKTRYIHNKLLVADWLRCQQQLPQEQLGDRTCNGPNRLQCNLI